MGPENSFRTKFGGEYSWGCGEKGEKIDATENLQRSGRPGKLYDANARYIARKVKKETFLTRSEIQKDLQEASMEASKDTIKRSLNRSGLNS